MESIYNAARFHPFFQGIDEAEAYELLTLCQLKHYQKSDIIFHANEQREGLLLLLDGIAEVYVKTWKNQDRQEVLEVVQKGDMIGFSSLADFLGVAKNAKDPKPEQVVEVRATESVTALLIPFLVITKRWDDPNVHDYLLTQVALRLKDIYTSLAEQVKLARQFGESDPLVMRVQDVMSSSVVAVNPATSIKELAAKMIAHRISSVLVIEDEQLKGIVTERDLLERVISQSRSYEEAAEVIMTKNPYTISRFAYFYDALSILLLNGVKHLPVVDDNKVVGVVSLSDLLRKKNESMMRSIQKIDQADADTLSNVKLAIYDALETLIQDNVPILHTLEVITKLYDRLVSRCIDLALLSLKKEGREVPAPFCFYQMGSSGRAEQFLLTDQDHFIVYEESGSHQDNEAYFSRLGEETVRLLEKAGYVRCKGKMMASERNWRGSIGHWQDRLRMWSIQSTNDHLLLAQNFFSYRFVYGDHLLNDKFEAKIKDQLLRSKIFLYRLTQVEKEHQIPSLEQPVRSLFRLERKQVDMKKEILFPYHHSLQILSLLHGIVSGTPIERIEQLMEKQVISEGFAKDIKTAIAEIMKIYVKQKWQQHKRNEPSSSLLHFTHLTTWDKEQLILSLRTLRELQAQVFANFTV